MKIVNFLLTNFLVLLLLFQKTQTHNVQYILSITSFFSSFPDSKFQDFDALHNNNYNLNLPFTVAMQL